MIRVLMLLTFPLWAEVYSVDISPKNSNHTIGHIRILDQKEIVLERISNLPFSEISDIAYNNKTGVLHMVGDKGYLYRFKAVLSKNRIEQLEPLSGYKLTKEIGRRFNKKVDSEGLTLDNSDNLIISFERRPKIGRFSQKGHRVKKERLPKKLKNRKSYRSGNKMLESVALHPKYGILTVSELPLKNSPPKLQTIYALNGKKWDFSAEPDKNSAVTAIEVMDDGNILVLERSYSGLTNPRVITLKKVLLDKKDNGLCKTQVLAKMNSDDGWAVDNFEGLAKVAPHRYLMISDDNGNFFQKTLLIYFEVLE